MGLEDIFKIFVLFIIFIIFIIWMVYYLYSIKLANRVKNTTIKSNNIESNSIIDDIVSWYNKEKKKIANRLIRNNINDDEREKNINVSIDAIFCSISLIIVYLFLSLFYLSVPTFSMILLIALIGLFIPNMLLLLKKERDKKQIERNLLKTITLINNGLASGKTIRDSICAAKDKLDGAIRIEIEKVIYDLEHGLSLEVAFSRMQQRTNVKDIIYLTTSLSMLSRTGGNIVLMFDYLEKLFNTRNKLEQELSATVASSKLVFIIMSIVPIIIFTGMMMLYPNYLTLFASSSLGKLIGILIALLYILYVIIIRKIMKIEKY